MIPYSDINSNDYQTKSEAKKEFIIISEDLNLKEDISSHDTDIANLISQINLKENITDHDTDINNINTALNTKESKTDHDTDMTNINTALNNKVSSSTYAQGMTNVNTELALKESITAHNADITQLSNAINNLQTNLFQGDQKPALKNNVRPGVILNYNLGGILFWDEDGHGASLNNIDGEFTLNPNITSLTLPTNIKSPNGQTNIGELIYKIDGPTNTRQRLPNLKSISVPTGVKKINFDLSATPNLKYFNLMEGLEELILSSPSLITIPSLKIPSSVYICSLTNCAFYNLEFEGGANNTAELQLTITNCPITNKIICERELTINSSITNDFIARIGRKLNYLIVDYSFLARITPVSGEVMVSYNSTLFLTGVQLGSEAYPSFHLKIHFKVIHNLIGVNHSYYPDLTAGTWIE